MSSRELLLDWTRDFQEGTLVELYEWGMGMKRLSPTLKHLCGMLSWIASPGESNSVWRGRAPDHGSGLAFQKKHKVPESVHLAVVFSHNGGQFPAP